MDLNNSLVMTSEVIATLVADVSSLLPGWFPHPVAKRTANKISKRLASEGIGFLTKTLPALGKALDRALSGEHPIDCLYFRKKAGTQLPMLFGELFEQVFTKEGWVLPNPSIECIRLLRQVLYLFYKYELPYDKSDEQKVLDQFERTEEELEFNPPAETSAILDDARSLLEEILYHFDVTDITPRHGPGSVATGEHVYEKMVFRRLYESVESVFPYSEYYYSSLAHVCDRYDHLQSLEVVPNGIAKVLLVPKDSRGPRLISCEPLEIQWIQQGLRGALYSYVERHPLTRRCVFFTDQEPNRQAALKSSVTGAYATLDLKEASDRVSLALVRRLFPEHVYRALEATRSMATVLPNGKTITLHKFAAMGSALCFPIMALTIFAIVSSVRRRLGKKNWRKACSDFLVYGDDVIIPTAQAADVIKALEDVGLMVNRDKSFLTGFFRESCGLDAYKGVEVQPVRIRTVWTSSRSASAYTSWMSYANSFWNLGCKSTAQLIAERIIQTYGPVPTVRDGLPIEDSQEFSDLCPSLVFDPLVKNALRKKASSALPENHRFFGVQRLLSYVLVVKPVLKHLHSFDGWCELLRFLTMESEEFTAGIYALPRASKLARRWR